MNYAPPFKITSKSINLIAEISEKIGILTALSENPLHVELRKENRIKTIHLANKTKKVTVNVTAKVTANREKIIAELQKNPYMTQKELSEIVGISLKSIRENMKKMQESNILRRIGADKNGYWSVICE